jgi:hypothetical protein
MISFSVEAHFSGLFRNFVVAKVKSKWRMPLFSKGILIADAPFGPYALLTPFDLFRDF